MVMVEETHVQEILQNLEEVPQSVRSLAEKTGLPVERVFRYVTALKRKEMIALDQMAERTRLRHHPTEGVSKWKIKKY